MHDVIIIGAGPAGLSAALILGRCRRRVVVVDSGQPRNGASRALHGFLSRDGSTPHELRRIGREQLSSYPNVKVFDDTISQVRRADEGFEVTTIGSTLRARFVLFATGRDDVIPEQPGFRELMGRGVYHCPLCDGWDHRDEPLVLYSPEPAIELAIELLTWSDDVTVCTNGSADWSVEDRDTLGRHGIRALDATVVSLQGAEQLERIEFLDAPSVACSALFFCSDCTQKSKLPADVGCSLDQDGSVICDGPAARGVPGVYVAGNVRGGIHLAIVAAAEGAEAGAAINDALVDAGIFPIRGSV